MKNKRLFLVAGYSVKNNIDAALIFMLKALSKLGDVILIMDNDLPKSELKKIAPYVIYADAFRHYEYDFGSYKYAYTYAYNNKILPEYDIVYFINDSVYGPLLPIEKILNKIENFNTNIFGLVCNPHKKHHHIQSWFIGVKKKVVMKSWFHKFITSVTKQESKGAITYLYEQGFTKLIEDNDEKWQCEFSVPGRRIYNDVKKLYLMGIPFMKKAAFNRHNGALGRQILYVLNHTDKDIKNAILSGASETFGKEYINWLLTKNPIKILLRNIKYFIHKISNEGL